MEYLDQWIEIKEKEKEKKYSSASQYTSVRNALAKFWKKRAALQFSDEDVDSKFLHQFERWLRGERNCKDTSISVYMRAIRTMDNFSMTTYVGRHTYATTLKNAGVSISMISEALGHETEQVTQIYLKQFEHEELDRADLDAL